MAFPQNKMAYIALRSATQWATGTFGSVYIMVGL